MERVEENLLDSMLRGGLYFSRGGAAAINPLALLDGAVNQPTLLDGVCEREPLGLNAAVMSYFSRRGAGGRSPPIHSHCLTER